MECHNRKLQHIRRIMDHVKSSKSYGYQPEALIATLNTSMLKSLACYASLPRTMASRFTIYSNKQISYIVYKISSLINKISTLFY